jgi:hypothetical protein
MQDFSRFWIHNIANYNIGIGLFLYPFFLLFGSHSLQKIHCYARFLPFCCQGWARGEGQD